MATPFIRTLYNVSVSKVRLLSTTLRSLSKIAPGISQLIKCCGLAKKSRFMISSQGLAMHAIPPLTSLRGRPVYHSAYQLSSKYGRGFSLFPPPFGSSPFHLYQLTRHHRDFILHAWYIDGGANVLFKEYEQEHPIH